MFRLERLERCHTTLTRARRNGNKYGGDKPNLARRTTLGEREHSSQIAAELENRVIGGGKGKLTSTDILVGVLPAAETRFSAGIMVQSEHVTCKGVVQADKRVKSHESHESQGRQERTKKARVVISSSGRGRQDNPAFSLEET